MSDKSKVREAQRELMNTMNSMHKLRISDLSPYLSHGEFRTMKVLIHCSDKKKPRVSDVVKTLCIPPPAVSRTLKNLETKGYIERTVDKEDRRNTFVMVTEAGKKAFDETMEILEDFADSVFGTMGEEKINQMNDFFKKLFEAAEEEIEKRKLESKKGE